MKRSLVIILSSAALAILFIWYLNDDGITVPKPKGYFRIALPEKKYTEYKSACPVKMEVPIYSRIEVLQDSLKSDSCRFNIFLPRFKARVHCTYFPVGSNYDKLIHDAYGFAARHEMKATALKRTLVDDRQRRVYGIVYEIEGDAASQMQFFVTDSLNHFFRGSLYFYNTPNADSIAPVLAFLREDLMHLTSTLEWK